ncbi:MAG: D-alanyl-D-alanine dipeptidase, partial [Bacteroidetes bacterium]|nr:D-alanyl-D-alanine dipeptidase [Bacteroidota bacterium]
MLRILPVILLIPVLSWGQNKYGLQTMRLQEYKSSLAAHPEKQLVDLQKELPGVLFQIGYATTENFTKTKIYNLAKAYARKPVAEALKHAQADFVKMGYSIKIYDAYRPYSATVKF